MLDKYILNDKREPIPVEDDAGWYEWFEKGENRLVARTKVGRLMVSTVFTGYDHNFSDHGPPILFETMIFGGEPGYEPQWRCSTWTDALLMHDLAVIEAEAEVARKTRKDT